MIFNYSPYLSNIWQQFESQLRALPELDHEALSLLIDSVNQLECNDQFPQQLRSLKAQFSFRWAIARLQQSINSEQLGKLQTQFAEASINRALQVAWADPQFTRLLPKQNKPFNGAVPGLFILGLGKLGGNDLNFSSDVDLIAFYDPDILPISSVHGRTDVCNKLLKKLTQLLAKSIDGLFVWRVDWRLRPNASTMSLTMPTDLAEEFYFFQSMPWHRLAMIKARVIAGDLSAGDSFLATLEPYLWRQNLDYQMIDEIHRLKNKINLEHPQLKQARDSGHLYDREHGRGFNLKLGHGGIREIEFIVNAIQLIWGGKKPLLRSKSTIDLLKKIPNAELIDHNTSTGLIKAYQYLRWLEDAIQIQDNFQEHKIPTDDQKFTTLLKLIDTEESQLWQKLEAHRQHVTVVFNSAFSQDKHSTNSGNTLSQWVEPDWINDLPIVQKQLCEAWSKGFMIYAVSPKQAESLHPLFISICTLLEDAGIHRVNAVNKLHEFFNAIPKGGQYLRLLAQHPKLLNSIAIPLIHSPHMTELLEQSPHIVDFLLEPNSSSYTHQDSFFDSDFILQTNDFEFRLERLRRFVNEQLYASALQLIQGSITSIELQQRLTSLAEHTLQLGMTITNQSMNLSEAPIAVIGMGKLGMRAMAPMSDLDLIFIASDNVDIEIANEYSHRLQHLMALRSKEGRAYEMDMRLRPSGHSGPVTVSINSFEHYHQTRAKTWEHIALTAARVVSGPKKLRQKIEQVRSNILSQPRNKTQFMLDAAKMLWRLQNQRIGQSKKNGLDVKLRHGGLMELDYLSACACLLAQPTTKIISLPYDQMISSVLSSNHVPNIVNALGKNPPTENGIEQSTRFWRQLQIWSRLLGLDDMPLNQLQTHLLDTLLNDMELGSLTELNNAIETTSLTVKQFIKNMSIEFEQQKPKEWSEWVEMPVQWEE